MSEERQKHLAKVRENMTRGDHNTVPAPKAGGRWRMTTTG